MSFGWIVKMERLYVKVNPKFYRPAELDLLNLETIARAEKILGWRPKTSLEELCSTDGRGRYKQGITHWILRFSHTRFLIFWSKIIYDAKRLS